MTTTRPTTGPNWADTLVLDPTSAQYNRVEPPAAWRTGEGFTLGEKPPRNYLNWWMYNIGQWTQYLDERRAGNLLAFVCASDASATHKSFADAAYLCDGAADEVQINAAITAVAAAGGGVVLLSPGTFTIAAQIALVDKIALIGSGKGATTITVANGIGTEFSFIFSDGDDTSVRSLKVNGNSGGITGGFGHVGIELGVNALRSSVEDVYVTSMKTTGATNGIGIKLAEYNQAIRKSFVYSCENHGILVDATATDAVVEDTLCNSCGADGIHVDGAGCTLNNVRSVLATAIGIDIDGATCKLIGCRAQTSGTVGIYATGSNTEVIGCTSDLSSTHGIVFDGVDGGQIVNCRIADNSQGTTDTSAGILLTGAACVGIMVHGNRVTGADHKYCVQLAAAPNEPTNCFIFGNDLRGFTTSAFVDPAGTAETIPAYIPQGTAAAVDHVYNDVAQANQVS